MLIELNDVALSHEEDPVLSHVNFQVDRGDFVYIVGKVGSGKSTLLKSLYGEVPVKKGQARILDYDLRKLKNKHIPPLRRKLGIVFQKFELLHDRTVRQNLDFVLRATGWKKKLRPQRMAEVLELVGLADKIDRYPHELSGGEQQRVAIARALALHPDILCFDEPTSALDPELTGEVLRVLRELAEHKTTMIIVTHEMKFARDAADRILFMDGGVVVEQGDARELIDHPKEERTRQFLASYGK